MSSSTSTQTLRQLDDLIKDIASLTGMSQRQIKEQVKTIDVPSFNFQGIMLVPSDVVDPLIDQWAADIKTKLHKGTTIAIPEANGSAASAAVSATVAEPAPKAASKSKKAAKAEQNGAAAKPVAKAEAKPAAKPEVKEAKTEAKPEAETKAKAAPEEKPEAKSETKTPAPKKETKLSELKLPKGFSQQVSNRYGPTLDKLLPEDFEERLIYLKEIIDESSLGSSYLNRIATVIQRKYKGRTARSTAYRGLLGKAQDMLENLKAGDEIMNQLEKETA